MNIRLLPDNVVNQIAAGEVVERPASVIKELVENSIDAGATRIEIAVKNGGASLISIADNGCGMDKADLAMSIQRHATSKMDDEDLFSINTFGFRGEALASISSIAKVSIRSKVSGGNDAWELKIEAGKQEEIIPAALNEGTKIEVRDLFFSTPARLKFLKADTTELRYIKDAIEKIAMANPDVSIYLINNDKKSMSFEASDWKDRIDSVMGSEFSEKSIEMKAKVNDISLSGYIGIPSYNKANSLAQFVFVNGRPVKDKLIMGAIRAGYMDVIEHGRYPAVALFITVPSAEVDVNVHPAKSEVRFKDTRVIRSVIVHAIKEAIESNRGDDTQGIFEINTKFNNDSYNGSNHQYAYSKPSSSAGFRDSVQSSFITQAPSVRAEDPINYSNDINEVNVDNVVAEDYPLGSAKAQLHKNYIVSQTDDAVFLVDQHAAHERIVYESIKEKLEQGGVDAQNLLIPEVVELKSSDRDALLDKKDELYKLGMEIDSFGDEAVVVRSLPSLLRDRVDIKQLITDLSDEIIDMGNSEILLSKLYEVCATIACHGSVRSGRILNIAEMNELLRQMEGCKNIQQCNHGRPTYVKLSLKDIEKLFDR